MHGSESEWIASYQGLSVQEALDHATGEGRLVEVIPPDGQWTLDYRPDRLRIFLASDGAIALVHTG